MKTHLRLFVVTGLTKLRLHLLLMVAVAAIAFPSLISAAPVEASGTWDDCNFAPVFRAAGPNTVETVGITENFFGTLLGTYAGTERDLVYADGGSHPCEGLSHAGRNDVCASRACIGLVCLIPTLFSALSSSPFAMVGHRSCALPPG